MGVCIYNNVAIAARRATAAHGARRVLILDWDVHYGNGTTTRSTPPTTSCSPPSTSGRCTPAPARQATGAPVAGEGYTLNLPVPPGTGDETYRSLVDHVVCPLIRAWEP